MTSSVQCVCIPSMSHVAVKIVAAKDKPLLPVSMNTPESRCQQLLEDIKGGLLTHNIAVLSARVSFRQKYNTD